MGKSIIKHESTHVNDASLEPVSTYTSQPTYSNPRSAFQVYRLACKFWTCVYQAPRHVDSLTLKNRPYPTRQKPTRLSPASCGHFSCCLGQSTHCITFLHGVVL